MSPIQGPEELYDITITDTYVMVEHPEQETQKINWADIVEINIITTDQGPFEPDVWLCLVGQHAECRIPQGAVGYDTVYDRVSGYEHFSFDNVIKAMGSVENVQFLLWRKPNRVLPDSGVKGR